MDSSDTLGEQPAGPAELHRRARSAVPAEPNKTAASEDNGEDDSLDESANDKARKNFRWRVTWGILLTMLPLEFALKYLAWKHRTTQMLLKIPVPWLQLDWTYSENPHSALGFLEGVDPQILQYIYVLLGFVVFGAACWLFQPGRRQLLRFGVACYVVGGIGNLVDRALVSFVVDYLRFTAIYSSW
eukprot:CAMPEP_0206430382 /NCGR_PEP_ID=MMETSP0324_2-20121206/6783_1 /ASSEMBLY_ACC=CAM_ASM_000836 /TAXON_ID=2866 /ORGANISM="Crypthecodinium cohnii, Strain Seligo" /LENGTH=185 /DNA_ID=CAMNT_0053896203 /DNA_START=158 /DNA_END=712 /DNA_ORIENTATION=+